MRKIKKMMNTVLVLAVLVFCLTACGEQKDSEVSQIPNDNTETETALNETQNEPQKKQDKTDNEGGADMNTETDNGKNESKVLVAYFSATGTTKRLAEYATEVMSADLYEIIPAEPYTDADLNWNDNQSRTSIEMNDKSIKPAINGNVSDMAQYDIVFIAYPIWWGDAPHIMDTFMESYDFSGKTIIPFCTSGSSGIGSSAKNLHDYTDDSVTWLDGERFSGSSSKEDIADWIKGLSLGIEIE